MKILLRIGLLTGLAATGILADVSYEQTTHYTGGTLIEAMQAMANNPIMGRLGGSKLKAAFQDQTAHVYVKGAKMAHIGDLISAIYDLDASTITTVDHQKRTYTVMTFEEMRQQIEQMQQKMNRGQTSDVQFDVKVEKTGKTRNLNGQPATELLLTLTAKSAGSNGQMVVHSDNWLVPLDAPAHELMDYGKRLQEKFGYAFTGAPALGAAAAGINAAMKESMAQDGYPVLTDMDVSGVTSPMAASPFGRSNSDPNAPLIKMEMQSSNFVQGPVDDSKFSVPAGYKQESRKH
jgi:hypothetical protein